MQVCAASLVSSGCGYGLVVGQARWPGTGLGVEPGWERPVGDLVGAGPQGCCRVGSIGVGAGCVRRVASEEGMRPGAAHPRGAAPLRNGPRRPRTRSTPLTPLTRHDRLGAVGSAGEVVGGVLRLGPLQGTRDGFQWREVLRGFRATAAGRAPGYGWRAWRASREGTRGGRWRIHHAGSPSSRNLTGRASRGQACQVTTGRGSGATPVSTRSWVRMPVGPA